MAPFTIAPNPTAGESAAGTASGASPKARPARPSVEVASRRPAQAPLSIRML